MRTNRTSSRTLSSSLLLPVVAALAGGLGCGSSGGSQVSSPQEVRYAYVLMGPDGGAVARAITTASTCPAISLDGGAPVQMALHAAAAVEPVRPTAYSAIYSEPAAFPVTTCDLAIPAGTVRATLGERVLPMPRPHVRRILMIGDTGCRMKAKGPPPDTAGEFQDCNDPAAWPFPAIAGVAASTEPDLVVHVGDFHYRETYCPVGTSCAAVTNFGFGWSSWEPDFFAPSAPLFAVAPWVMVRGDHETCDRGGQGWWRFLDPRPLRPGRDCNAVADDPIGSYSEPYVVPLDSDLAAVVFDSNSVGNTYNAESTEAQTYSQQAQRGFALAAPWAHSIFLNHQPILAYNSGGSANPGTPSPGNPVLQGVLQQIYGTSLFPGAVDAVLSGHVHLAQVTGFSTGQPPTFVTGNGGTNLIKAFTVYPPSNFPTPPTPYPAGTMSEFLQDQAFGFMLMERTATGWTVTVYDQTGGKASTCTVLNRVTTCTKIAGSG